MRIETGCDLFKLMDMAEDIIVPMMDHMVRVDRSSLTLGFAGVYSTFLLHAKRAAERFGVPARDILVELGRKKMIGGQEDMIVDVALDLLKAQEHERIHAMPVMSEALNPHDSAMMTPDTEPSTLVAPLTPQHQGIIDCDQA